MIQSVFTSIFSRSRITVSGLSSGANQLSSSLRISSPVNSQPQDAAVKVAFSQTAKNKSEAAASLSNSNSPSSGGMFGQLLSSIASVTEQLAQLQEKSSSDGLTQEQKNAFADEIKNLSSEYARIVTSDSYKQITSIAEQVRQSLQSGGSNQGLYSSLLSQRDLLGDNFLSIVRNGDALRANSLSDNISKLGSADSAALGTDKTLTNDILASIHKAIDALSGMSNYAGQEQSLAIPVIQRPGDTIQPTQLTFAGAEDISLSLRSYSTSDMLKLASVHADINPVSVLMLVANPLKDGQKHESALNPDPNQPNT